MKVITVSGRKGGGGKTTTARHLAVEAARQGAGPACIVDADIVDADPMLGLTGWWARRQDNEPRLLHTLPTTEEVTAANIKRLVGEGNIPLPIARLSATIKAAKNAVAVTMNFGPLVLTNFGPPPG